MKVGSCEKFWDYTSIIHPFVRLSSINQSIILPAESDTVDSNSFNFVPDSLNVLRFVFWRVGLPGSGASSSTD